MLVTVLAARASANDSLAEAYHALLIKLLDASLIKLFHRNKGLHHGS